MMPKVCPARIARGRTAWRLPGCSGSVKQRNLIDPLHRPASWPQGQDAGSRSSYNRPADPIALSSDGVGIAVSRKRTASYG